eukprot:jgi/Tetstr1/442544/TSEL_030642.t1
MPLAGLRPQWREEHALEEDTTTTTMDIDRYEEQHDAGAGTFLAARRGGRVQQPAIRTPHWHAGVRAWAEYEADTDAEDAVTCPPTRTLLALLEVREVWKARRSADSVRLELLDPDAARVLWDVCRDAVLALPFGDQTQGRAVVQITVEHSEEREDPPTTPHHGVLPPPLSQQFFRCALTAKAICTGPLANLELPTVELLAEAIASTIGQRINTPPEVQHAQWLTDTLKAVGVEMQQHHTEPTLLRVGDENLCAISLGKEDEEFADTLRMAVALTSPIALLRAVRLRTIVIYLTESEFDPSELLVHPFSQTVREAGELGSNTGHNQLRCTAMGPRKKARKTPPSSLALRAEQRPVYTLTMQLTARHHSIIGGIRGTDRTEQWRKTAVALAATATTGVHADDEAKLELNYEENDITMDVDTAQHGAAETPGKGKAATSAKHEKKHPMGRSHSGGTTRNRSKSKPRLSSTHASDSKWETDDETAQPSRSSHH